MFRNYLKTAYRNLWKNRLYSGINLSGLAVGLAVGVLILLWVQDEFSFDRFHEKADNIYKLENMVGTGSSRQLWTITAAPISELAKKEIPGVEDAVRITYNGYYRLFKYSDKVFTAQNTFFTDPSLFNIFDYKLLKGDPKNPYPDANSVVLTETIAKKYFGNDDPLGKVIMADDSVALKVTGVAKDFPTNSTFYAEMLFPMQLLGNNRYRYITDGKNLLNDFGQFDFQTFLLMKPGFSFAGFTTKLRDIHLRVKPEDTDIEYVLMPLSKMHLFRADGTDGGYATVRMFLIIGILVLVIACINYVNLSTARSLLRAKEVSLRKMIGAAKAQLFFQFIIETALLFLLATICALALIYLLLPVFNSIAGKEIVFGVSIWKILLPVAIGTLIISSIYPAILLSSFEPLKALKGKITQRISDAMFRKALVVVQFSFSLVLITGTIVIGNQLSYIRSKQLGYDKDHVIAVNMMGMKQHLDAVKADLENTRGIEKVTTASVNIVRYGGLTGNNWWEGKEDGETLMISPMAVDRNFMSFFSMQLIKGKGFSGTNADSMHYIINEAAAKALRMSDPIGKKFKMWETVGTIVGVVKDFHFSSMRNKIEPAVFYYKPSNYSQLYVKTNGKDAQLAIAALEKQWKKYNGDFPFSYSFLDETFNSLYKSEQRTGLLFNVFAGIAIFISCLGLFGLSAYTAQVRTREIGVRKTLGATVTGIVQLLAFDFVELVLIAIVIATPVSWYVMTKWLQDFAYKVNLGWMVFVLAGLISLVIAFMAISFQSVKAALMNPVRSLRTES